MRLFIPFVAVLLMSGLAGAKPAEARAICKGKPQITLKDGTSACILQKEVIELTRTQTGLPGWGSESQIQKADGGLVIVNFRDEANYRDVPFETREARREEICRTFRDEFRAKIKRPRDPFMLVILTWGERPTRSERGRPGDYTWTESYHGRLCNELRSR